MKPSTVLKREDPTERIIAAAGAVFAERGFRGTTIRQITARAGVNLAAVNYYFRDKNELYIRVLREAKRCTGEIDIEKIEGNPEERLRTFIGRFVRYLLDPQRPAWHGRVLAMEMSNPTPALGVILRELTAPVYRDVRALVSQVLGEKASPAELDLFTLSIFGQCIFYVSRRPIVEQLAADLEKIPDRLDRIADHIGTFSLAGMHDFRQRPATAKTPRAPRAREKNLSTR
jgi:AcrR family transcriptional regulator